MKTHFDIFTIRQWQSGYTVQVGIARPNNAPRFKRTAADSKRTVMASEKNIELAEKVFTLEEVLALIKDLSYPIEKASL